MATNAPITMVQLAEWETDYVAESLIPMMLNAPTGVQLPRILRERYFALIAEVRRLSDRVNQLEDWGFGPVRFAKPFPPVSTRVVDADQDDERASEPPDSARTVEEAPERADFAADGGYRARRV